MGGHRGARSSASTTEPRLAHGVPGPRANAQAILDLGLERQTTQKILYKNALEVYALGEQGFENALAGKDREANTP